MLGLSETPGSIDGMLTLLVPGHGDRERRRTCCRSLP